MIRRLRSRAALVLSILSLGIGLAMSAAAQGRAFAVNAGQGRNGFFQVYFEAVGSQASLCLGMSCCFVFLLSA